MNVIVPAASFTVTSLIVMFGGGSLSTIVPVPTALGFVVLPAVRVAVSVKVSLFSSSVSFTIGVRTSTLSVPAGIVALVASTHEIPPSVETCRLPAPPVP